MRSNEPKLNPSAKRVDLVSLKIVKESSVLYENRKISSPQEAINLVKPLLEDRDREYMVVLCLDIKMQPTLMNIASIGSLNAAVVHPREIFKLAVMSNAASLIIFHNHPSGDCSPSTEDIAITNRLDEAGKILGIALNDHIIITADGAYYSLKEHNQF